MFMLSCIRGTSATTGLQVEAYLVEKVYAKGIKVTKEVMQTLQIVWHSVCPRWNYTIMPRQT